jgi:hypothetical protein
MFVDAGVGGVREPSHVAILNRIIVESARRTAHDEVADGVMRQIVVTKPLTS